MHFSDLDLYEDYFWSGELLDKKKKIIILDFFLFVCFCLFVWMFLLLVWVMTKYMASKINKQTQKQTVRNCLRVWQYLMYAWVISFFFSLAPYYIIIKFSQKLDIQDLPCSSCSVSPGITTGSYGSYIVGLIGPP